MKPVPFAYCRAETLDEALDLLAEFGEDAAVLAGGMSLGAMLNMRLVRPAAVIDVNRLTALAGVVEDGGWIETGALVRQAAAMASSAVAAQVPLLAAALPHVGHFQTRGRGTLGGSVAHADPSAEIPLALAALGGQVVLAARGGRRTLPASRFFRGILTTARAPDELLVALRWPAAAPGRAHAFDEVARRRGDFAIAAAAAAAEVDGGGTVRALALGLGGIEDRPLVVDTGPFVGAPATAETAAALAEKAADEAEPLADSHASGAYRRQLARVLGARVVGRAFEAASGRG